jgi:SAM-dependent methyltransferase
MDKSDPAYKGQAGYNRFMLAIYDPWVIGFMAPVVWKAPVEPALAGYRQHLGQRHLDVGPGTGYFIEKAEPPEGTEITLLDPNPKVLARSSRRLASLNPVTVEADVMKPLPLQGRFDSAALSFVLHCLPGPLEHKAVAISNIAAVLEPDGVLFGGTVLGTEAEHSRAARGVLRAFNRQGAFDNLGDTADGLQAILEGSFRDVEVEATRSVAHFIARRPIGGDR